MTASTAHAFRHALRLVLVTAVVRPAVAQQGQLPKNLDALVTRVMRQFAVPGLALAVVKDGKIVVAKGYGVRKLGSPAPVDANTLFGIASNTKLFTATALAMLVEEGLLEWDAPVVTYLPAFAMYDPWVTRQITIRDLLVHRSGLGLGAGDLLWWPSSSYTRKEIANRLRFIAPATSFRSAYAYDNVLYLVAGEVIEAVSGLSWEQFVQTRILARLGMSGTRILGPPMVPENGNVATPHARVDGIVRPVTPFAKENINPAGGINASVDDMAKWLIVQLDSGRLGDGARLFSPRSARELWTTVVPRPGIVPPPELPPLRSSFDGYALGLNVRDYRGEKLVLHTGGLPGYVSRVAFLPDRKLGVVVLTNMESGAAFDAIAWTIIDSYLGAPPFDWLAGYVALEQRRAAETAEAEHQTAAQRDSTSRPSLPPARYAGTYHDAWYGDVTIALENAGLVIRFGHTPSLVGDLTHWQYDTFVARWRNHELRADAFVTFTLDPAGGIAEARMQAVSPATDFSFDFQDLLLKPKPPSH
jgi:CubicO group peptidase (beta-lactamase class C family)